MATPTQGGTIWLCTFRYNLNNQILLNTFPYQQSSTPTLDYVAFAQAIVLAMQAPGSLQDSILQSITADCALASITLQPIRPIRYQAVVVAVGQNGQQAGLAAPQNVAQSIERRGVIAARDNIGRIQLPPCAASGIVNGGFTLLQAAQLQGVATAMMANFASGVPAVSLSPVLISKDPTIVPRPITGTTVKLSSRVMRRRTVGVGQ